MPTSSLNCGNFTLSLIDAVTGVAVSPATYTLDLSQASSPKVKVLYTNPSQLVDSPFKIAIKATEEIKLIQQKRIELERKDQ